MNEKYNKSNRAELEMSTIELQAVRSLNMSTKERAEIGSEIVKKIVDRFGIGSTQPIEQVVESMDGELSRTPSEIVQAIDFGEAQGRLELDLSKRTITIIR